MDIPKKAIKLLGKPYFNEEFLQKFIATIESIAPKPEKCFFQLSQKDDKPTLEFGCKADHILLNVTASTENRSSSVILFSALKTISLYDSPNLTQLRCRSSARVIITYVAVTEQSREDLRDYARFLQKKIGLSENGNQ